MRIGAIIALWLSVLVLPAAGQSPVAVAPSLAAPAKSASVAEPSPSGARLSKPDVDAWLDGLVPYGLATGGIAGGVAVVVQDGRVLTERGYGYADVARHVPVDPDATLFRPGSISKLFTWTAVMQQVQAGRLDLDRDVNAYLDFAIPPAFGRPITLRDLMTHTAGFEETVKYLISTNAATKPSLAAALRCCVPARIRPPGKIASYSNYGASLAGYIVQRVSGEPFEVYVGRHILAPLGMTRSSFAQPLPPALAARLARGYDVATGDPQVYEIIPLSPAGALSATGADMARFMIAFLSPANPLLDQATARRMAAAVERPIPGLPGMALGFYHEDRNGLTIIGHGGDTRWFHSDLHLYLDKGVGLYVSFNSAGNGGTAAHVLRQRLFDGFTDRYFPAPVPALPTLATARAHGRAMAGRYITSRSSLTNWLRIATLLGETRVTLNADDTISVSTLTDAAGAPRRWHEVAPWQWQETNGADRLGATVQGGRVTAFAPREFAPIILFLPAPAALDAGWIVPALVAALVILSLTAVSWPVVALVRRHYGYRPAFDRRDRQLHRATRATAWILSVVAAGWMAMLLAVGDLARLDGRLDSLMRLLQLLTLVGIAGTLLSVWNAVAVARCDRWPRLATLWATLIAASALFLMWLAVDLKTLTLGLGY